MLVQGAPGPRAQGYGRVPAAPAQEAPWVTRQMWTHRDSVSHRGVLVRWTSRQQGQSSGRKGFSKRWKCTAEHSSLRRHLGFGRKRSLLCLRGSQRILEGGGLSHRVGMCQHSGLSLSLPASCAGRGLPGGGRDWLSVPGFAGTPGYLSPEVLRKDPYGKAVDLWACGESERGWDAGSGLGWAGRDEAGCSSSMSQVAVASHISGMSGWRICSGGGTLAWKTRSLPIQWHPSLKDHPLLVMYPKFPVR